MTTNHGNYHIFSLLGVPFLKHFQSKTAQEDSWNNFNEKSFQSTNFSRHCKNSKKFSLSSKWSVIENLQKTALVDSLWLLVQFNSQRKRLLDIKTTASLLDQSNLFCVVLVSNPGTKQLQNVQSFIGAKNGRLEKKFVTWKMGGWVYGWSCILVKLLFFLCQCFNKSRLLKRVAEASQKKPPPLGWQRSSQSLRLIRLGF